MFFILRNRQDFRTNVTFSGKKVTLIGKNAKTGKVYSRVIVNCKQKMKKSQVLGNGIGRQKPNSAKQTISPAKRRAFCRGEFCAIFLDSGFSSLCQGFILTNPVP